MYCLSKLINLFCSNSVHKLTPGYAFDHYFLFTPIPTKSNDLTLLKVQKPCFLLLAPTGYLPICKDTKNFYDFLWMPG